MTSEELRAFDYGGQCIAETYFLSMYIVGVMLSEI